MQSGPCTLAFVSGSEKEKERQKSEIREYCKRRFDVLPSDIEFLDSETILHEKLKEWKEWKEKYTKAEDTAAEVAKEEDIIVITDLRVISENPETLAGELHDVLVNRRIRIEVVKKEHRDLLEKYQPDRLTKNQLEFLGPRLLVALEELSRQIFE